MANTKRPRTVAECIQWANDYARDAMDEQIADGMVSADEIDPSEYLADSYTALLSVCMDPKAARKAAEFDLGFVPVAMQGA